MAVKWHDYFRYFVDGVGTSDLTEVCTKGYIGKELYDLWMPDDFEPKGMAEVVSPTIIRELYLLNFKKCFTASGNNKNTASGNNPNAKIGNNPITKKTGNPSPNNKKRIMYAMEVGKVLSRYPQDKLKIVSLYLSYGHRVFENREAELARDVLRKLKKEKIQKA